MDSTYQNPLDEFELGLGTWSWGDRFVWGYGHGYADDDIREVFLRSVQGGIRMLDTAEVYGQGRSEEIIGALLKETGENVFLATKFMPFPWRLSGKSLLSALRKSLGRLGLQSVDLYQIHWPWPPVTVETWMAAMVEAQHQGLIRAIGVSNYSLEQMRRAHDYLAKNGLRLASNQVEYHLLNRDVETNGVLQYCQEHNIRLIAYSPLAMGILTGKYTPENPPKGIRGNRYNRRTLAQIKPLLDMLARIGQDHEGKSAGQVALNWVIRKGGLAIPGAKNLKQMTQNEGALGWELTSSEINNLDEMSRKVLKNG